MGTNECSQPASKSSWDNQDFGDVNMVLKWLIFTSPPGHNELTHLPPGQNSRRFPDGIFKCIFMNETVSILIQISLKFVPKGLFHEKPACV